MSKSYFSLQRPGTQAEIPEESRLTYHLGAVAGKAYWRLSVTGKPLSYLSAAFIMLQN